MSTPATPYVTKRWKIEVINKKNIATAKTCYEKTVGFRY